MGFRAGDCPPPGRFGRSIAVLGRTGSVGLLLERNAEERRDDASAGDKRATQRA
jgi:hypothetical protein